MSLPMKPLRDTLFLIALAATLVWTWGPEVQAQARTPLTDFVPSKDFFQVDNDHPFDPGACLGTVEASVAYWAKGRPAGERLGKIGEGIMDWKRTTGEDGTFFLQEINTYAQNHSKKNAVNAPHTGDGLADILFEELKRTQRPQVLGIDQPSGDTPSRLLGKWDHAHALVAYDAEKTRDGRIVFSVGDPNQPGRDHLRVIYNPSSRKWENNFRAWNRGFRPCFVHWDEENETIAEIPEKEKLTKLMDGVKDIVKIVKANPGVTFEYSAHVIAVRAGVPVTGEGWECPDTKVDLGQPEQHPFIGSWTTSLGGTWTVDAGGRVDSVYPKPGTWRSTGANRAEVVFTYDVSRSSFTVTYQVTINDGQGQVTFSTKTTRGTARPYPASGSFTIRKR